MGRPEKRVETDIYAWQREYLAAELFHISQALFANGASPRIVRATTRRPGAMQIKGLAMLDKYYVPSLKSVEHAGGLALQLSLAALRIDDNNCAIPQAYLPLGTVDEPSMFYPYPRVPAAEAYSVYEAADGLQKLRDCGILPNLGTDLITIQSPARLVPFSLEHGESQHN